MQYTILFPYVVADPCRGTSSVAKLYLHYKKSAFCNQSLKTFPEIKTWLERK